MLAASSPSKAITLARKYSDRIDLLITDVIMPEMSGRQLVRNLSSICPHLKHLFMAGYTDKVILHHAGVPDEREHILQKSFSLKDLGTRLRQILEDQ